MNDNLFKDAYSGYTRGCGYTVCCDRYRGILKSIKVMW